MAGGHGGVSRVVGGLGRGVRRRWMRVWVLRGGGGVEEREVVSRLGFRRAEGRGDEGMCGARVRVSTRVEGSGKG